MIKKIDANKYGVVRYAISSIEDIADLPREVSVGSEAILVNEDGEKKFRLGSDGWVEVVEVKEYDEDKLRDILEDAKVGYGGIEYETLEERLDKDFDDVYSALDNRTYVEYEGCKITAKDSLNGLQKETVVKGRTLQNILKDNKFKYAGSMGSATISVDTKDEIKLTIDNDGSCVLVKDLKVDIVKGQIYTAIFDYYCSEPNIDFFYVSFKEGTNYLVGWKEIDYDDRTKYTRYRTTLTITDQSIPTSLCVGIHSPLKKGTELGIKNVMLLEGDHTQTPLEELPFIEGIESVGDKSKNLFDGVLLNNKINNSTGIILDKYSNEHYSSDFIQCDSLKTYTVSINYNDTVSELMLFEYDYEKNFIKKNSKISTNSLTVTLSNDTKYIRLSSFKGYGFNEYNFDFQLEEGTQATAYEPYYDGYKISGKSIGKNLFDINFCDTPSNNGLIFNRDNGELFVTGNSTDSYDIYIVGNNNKTLKLKKYINSLPIGTTLKLSNNLGLRNFFGFVNESGNVSYVLNNYTTKLNEKDIVCFVRIEAGQKFDNTQIKIQLEISSTSPTQYEPYREITYSHILDEPLRSLPNGLCDEIDLEKGVVTRRIGKIVLHENMDFALDKNEGWWRFVYPVENSLKVLTRQPILSNQFYFALHHAEGTGFIYNSYLYLYKFVDDASQFKTWLKSNPTTVYFELANPTTEYLIKDDKFVTLPNGVKDEAGRIVTRNVGKIVLDGSSDENWKVWSTSGENVYKFVVPMINLKLVGGNPLLCNNFKYLSSASTDEEGIYNGNTGGIGLKISKTKLTNGSTDEFREWLALNPITVYYQLETPYIECSYEKYPTLPNGVKDEISHNSVLRKVGKAVLDGSKVYESLSKVQGIVRWVYNIDGLKIGGSCICSMFDYVTPSQTWKEPFKDGITINSTDATIIIYIDKYKTIQHKKEVRALLDGLEVYYELETPYTEPINLNEVILDTIRLKSYEPITHIISDNYLPPTIKTQVPSDFNAVVLGLKSNNEALTSQVMSLRQTNDELETTNREQDDVIDVTLLALDEVYGMIDEGEIETMSIGSPMVNVYVKMIKRGIKTLDEVPAKYRAEVEELI